AAATDRSARLRPWALIAGAGLAGLFLRRPRRRRTLGDVARRELLHAVFQLERVVGAQIHALGVGAIAVEEQRELVTTRCGAQPLERAVVVVDQAGVVAVDVDG